MQSNCYSQRTFTAQGLRTLSARTFGWVQNPSSFDNLQRVVQIFIKESPSHNYLLRTLSDIVVDPQMAAHLLCVLSADEINPTYQDLVGTGSSVRSEAPCDALAQASVKAQKPGKRYVDNWSADGFTRWAECLGFIQYHEDTDSFTLTKRGRKFGTDSRPFKNNEALIEGLMAYPPVERVLQLLTDAHDNKAGHPHLSKFQIGACLGFSGEPGFTSLSHDLVMRHLADEPSQEMITKLRSNQEGSSDKYARMICRWLENMGWVDKHTTQINNPNFPKPLIFSHSYTVNLYGMQALKKIKGGSSHAAVSKNVTWYMLATNATNKVYLRNRRTALLNYLLRQNKAVGLQDIVEAMKGEGFTHIEGVFKKDIEGLNGCGINISNEGDKAKPLYRLHSKMAPVQLPQRQRRATLKDAELEHLKEGLLGKLTTIESSWVELIEISRDGKQNQIFEAKVAELLETHYNLYTVPLGGPSKPDCLLTIKGNNGSTIGVIVDMKAYKDGFTFSASEKDKMVRYIADNKRRDSSLNSTEWWLSFPPAAQDFRFLFVSSAFTSTVDNHLSYISQSTSTDGAALDVEQLLIGADLIASGAYPVESLHTHFKNTEITFPR